ncbi:MAG: RIP metalloprotease RseP [Bacteroidales bacterium]|nr:RIP metalloprotease RseP [Bacteroidales bacterium]
MVVLMKILQVILALSVLILFHELGHFLFAKLFGIRVDKFYLFFDIGGFKLFHFRIGQTEYGMGWLPLGGYCKIAGMIDESMDKEFLSHEPKPWEFRSKPAWQRLLVMAGGVLFNFILAIAVYIAISGIWGQTYIQNEGNAVYVNSLAREMGFRNGDQILKMDDYVPRDFSMLQADLARRDVGKVTVLRGNDTLDIYIDRRMIGSVLQTPDMFDLAVPFTVDTVLSAENAAVLQRDDRIVGLDSLSVPFLQDARPVLAAHPDTSLTAFILRGKDTVALTLAVDSLGHVGVVPRIPGLVHEEYTFFQAIPKGIKLTFSTIGGYLRDLKMVATPSTGAYKGVGSFIAIGQVFPSSWNWYAFLQILALLSIMLGVMNLLPIPGLDGGHIVFTLYEIFTGRKPSDRFLEIAQMIGLVLVLLLMFLAFGNDIGRLFK